MTPFRRGRGSGDRARTRPDVSGSGSGSEGLFRPSRTVIFSDLRRKSNRIVLETSEEYQVHLNRFLPSSIYYSAESVLGFLTSLFQFLSLPSRIRIRKLL